MRASWLAVVVALAGCGKEPNCAGMTANGHRLAGDHGDVVEEAIAACERKEYFEERTDCAAAAACLEAYFGCLHGSYAQCPAGPPVRTQPQRPPSLPFEEPRKAPPPQPSSASPDAGAGEPPKPSQAGSD
jgi:hypothetical protein